MKAWIDIHDYNFIKVSFEHEECKYLMKTYFEYKIDNNYLQYNSRFKYTKWDGVVRFYNVQLETIYFGLLDQVLKYLKRSYEIIISDRLQTFLDHKIPFVEVSNLEMRSYQRDTVLHCLNKKRVLVQSATSSGKTLMMFNIVRPLYQEHPTLIIVPTIGLVTQCAKAFERYGISSDQMHLIYNNAPKYTDKKIVISTWHSLKGLLSKDKEYFSRFKCIIVDEAHQATAPVIIKLVIACKNAMYRFGFSGTYFKEEQELVTLQGLFGQKYTAITTQEMIENNFAPEMEIYIVALNYHTDDRLAMKKASYADEMKFIETHEYRTKMVSKLSATRKGNTLTLYRKIVHGKLLYEIAKELYPDKQIYLLSGNDDNKDREKVIDIIENNTDCLVIASYGIFSTGISINNLNNVVFGSDMKSYNKIAQSIGRILRQLKGKDKVFVYDIMDNLSIKKKSNGTKLLIPYLNYAYKHAQARAKLYQHEGFDISIKQLDLINTYNKYNED